LPTSLAALREREGWGFLALYISALAGAHLKQEGHDEHQHDQNPQDTQRNIGGRNAKERRGQEAA